MYPVDNIWKTYYESKLEDEIEHEQEKTRFKWYFWQWRYWIYSWLLQNWFKLDKDDYIKELPFEEATDKVGNEQESATIFQYDGH